MVQWSAVRQMPDPFSHNIIIMMVKSRSLSGDVLRAFTLRDQLNVKLKVRFN